MKKQDLSRLIAYADDSQNAGFFFQDLAQELASHNPLGGECDGISKDLKNISSRIDLFSQKLRICGLTDEKKQHAVNHHRDKIEAIA